MRKTKLMFASLPALGLVTAACSSSPSNSATSTTSTTSGSGSADAILSPATTPPADKECTTAIATAADGTATPLQCADGAINTEAWRHYAAADSKMLGLGASATQQQVVAALCGAQSSLSDPIQQDAYTLARIYYGWSYSTDLAVTTLATSSTCG
jgi:hypothetical protein